LNILIIFITDCPVAFQKLGKAFSKSERKVIEESLNHKDVKECSQKCVKSQHCIAFAIGKNSAKPTGYKCRQYFKDSKELHKEVPACKKGNIYALFDKQFHF